MTIDSTAIILVLAAVGVGALFTLAGVFLGAWFVFRTKREPYETMIRPQPAEYKAKSMNVDPFRKEKPDPEKLRTMLRLHSIADSETSNKIKEARAAETIARDFQDRFQEQVGKDQVSNV